MNLEVKGVHYNISDTTLEFFNKKLERINFAKDNIVDLLITVTKEKQGYRIDGNIHFRWGKSAHIGVECFELYEGIESFIDKLELKVRKEKSKVKSHV